MNSKKETAKKTTPPERCRARSTCAHHVPRFRPTIFIFSSSRMSDSLCMKTELNDNITRTDLTLRIYISNVNKFLRAKETSSTRRWKLDDTPTLEWQIYWFTVVVKTLTGFEVWNQGRSKGTHWRRTRAKSMLNSPTNRSHLVLHSENSTPISLFDE